MLLGSLEGRVWACGEWEATGAVTGPLPTSPQERGSSREWDLASSPDGSELGSTVAQGTRLPSTRPATHGAPLCHEGRDVGETARVWPGKMRPRKQAPGFRRKSVLFP